MMSIFAPISKPTELLTQHNRAHFSFDFLSCSRTVDHGTMRRRSPDEGVLVFSIRPCKGIFGDSAKSHLFLAPKGNMKCKVTLLSSPRTGAKEFLPTRRTRKELNNADDVIKPNCDRVGVVEHVERSILKLLFDVLEHYTCSRIAHTFGIS